MDPARWLRVVALFEQAVELLPEERESWIRTNARDGELAELVLRMLREDAAEQGLDRSLGALAASLIDTPRAPHPVLAPSQRVGDYEILGVLGEGGMGVVYRARDTRLDRLAALKFLPLPEPGSDAAAVSAIEAEARAASALDHPNIATIYHVGADGDGRPFIAMAHYEGETLAERLKTGPLVPGEAIRIATAVAAGLAAAHSRGIVHRDVKPANIFLTRSGEVKLLDFGIAAAAGGHLGGSARGTLLYMSPEQARATAADPRADVWSLGAVLYEMLSGRPPFGGSSRLEIQTRKAASPKAPPLPRRRGIGVELQRIVARALGRDPAERYADGAELLAALERARRSRVHPAVLVGGCAALLALAFVSVRLRDAASTAEVSRSVVAVFPFEVQGDSTFGYLRDGMVNLLSADFDGVGGLRSVDPRAIRARMGPSGATLRDLGEASAAARALGAGRFILGQLVGLGGRLRGTASLYDQRGRLETSAQVEVAGETALFELVDRLAGQLLVGATRGNDQLRTLAASTTASLPALKAYLDGERLMREGRFEAAGATFERAVALDTAFALASYGLASARWWADRDQLAREPAARALRHAAALPRAARMEIVGQLERLDGDFVRAERLYRELTLLAPEAPGAWFGLADVLHHYNPMRGRPMREAVPYFERALALAPDNMTIRLHLANLAARERNFARHDSLVAGLPANAGFSRFIRLTSAFARGDSAAQDAAGREFLGADTRTIGEALHYVTRLAHNPRGALRFLELLAGNGRAEPELRLYRAGVLLTLGRWRDAVREIEVADSLGNRDAVATLSLWSLAPFVPADPALWRRLRARLEQSARGYSSATMVPHLRGMLAARSGDSTAALRLADSLDSRNAGTDAALRNAVAAIRAELAVRQGDSAAALRWLEQLRLQTNIAIEDQTASEFGYARFLRAELLAALGRWEEALGWYQGHIEVSTVESIYLAPAYFRLSALLRLRGDSTASATQLAYFRQIWEGADASLLDWAKREQPNR